MSRHSVVDVGSNTIHLLVGEVDGGSVLPVTGEKVSARLGAGVEKTGRLDEDRLALATILEHFSKEDLTVVRGGLREGTLLALAEGEEI